MKNVKWHDKPNWAFGSVAAVLAMSYFAVNLDKPSIAQPLTGNRATQPAPVQNEQLRELGELPDSGFAAKVPAKADHEPVTLNPSIMPVAERPPAAFTMADVERLRVRAWGSPELGGEYSVDPEQTISFPGIGRVPVGRLSTPELEALLSSRLSNLAGREVSVAVEVVRYQSFYIVGHIGEAGAQEWRPGLNVVQAISLARGVRRSEASGEAEATRHTMREQAQTQLQFALVQLARLRAEKEGSPTLAISNRLGELLRAASPAGQAQLRAFISQQNTMLAEQKGLIEVQLNGLNRERAAAVAELAETEVQSEQMSKQLAISRTMLRDIGVLKDKQLVANSRYLQQRSELIAVEIKFAEIRTLTERARSRLSGIESQIQRLQQERMAVVNDRIESLDREISQLELNVSEPDGGRAAASEMTIGFQIARKQGAEVKTIAAGVFTEVRPGDVIIVSGAGQAAGRGVNLADQSAAWLAHRALESSASSSQGNSTTRAGASQR